MSSPKNKNLKKVTMRDIAREAGVSVATVSYVINNNTNETIPSSTKNKIMTIAREMNYIPDLVARSLVSGKSGLIGVFIVNDYSVDFPWKKCYYSEFINWLERMFAIEGYHILLSNIDIENPKLDIIFQRDLEGVFIVDVRKNLFYELSNKFNVPIIIVDSYIDDLIFHKIVPDFESAIQKGKDLLGNNELFLVMDKFNNREMNQKIQYCFGGDEADIHMVESIYELEDFLKSHKGKKGIVLNEFLGTIVANFIDPPNIAVISTCGSSYIIPKRAKKVVFDVEKKAKTAVTIMMNYLNRKFAADKYTIFKEKEFSLKG